MATLHDITSPLDLLSGVALEHERRVRTDGEPGIAAAGRRSMAPPEPAPAPSSGSSPHLCTAQGARALPRPATPATLPPPPPRPRPRLAFPSILDLPPTTSSLVTRSSPNTYMRGDASGRAVIQRQQLVGSADGPLASLLATPRSHALSSPFTAPDGGRAQGSYGALHAVLPSAGGPRSVAMVRQQPSLPSHLDRPSGAPPAFVPSTILRPPVLPPLATTPAPGPSSRPRRLSLGEAGAVLERDEPSPISPPGRNAPFAVKASFEPLASVDDKKPPTKARKKVSGSKKGKAKAPPRPLSRINLPRRAPRDMDRCDSIVSCTLWEDERTVAMQVLVEGHVVARRADNDWVNATKIVNMVPGMTRGKRDTILKTRFGDSNRIIFRRGALHLKGVWVPLPDAAELAQEYDLSDLLYPLFEDNIRSFLFRPINKERTTLLVIATRERAALCKMPDASCGLSEELRDELRIRGEELERFLQYLENGLGRPGPSGPSSSVGSGRAQLGGNIRRHAQEHAHVHIEHAPDSLGGRRAASSAGVVVRTECEPPSPPTPPPSGGLPRSSRHQQGLAATYRTRFGFPPDGPPPLDAGPGRSSASHLTVTPHRHVQPSPAPPSILVDHAASQLEQNPHRAPATAVECPPRPFVDGPGGGPAFSWFDNPTPPEHPMSEYFGGLVPASRCSSVVRQHRSCVGDGQDEVVGSSHVLGAVSSSQQAPIDTHEAGEGLLGDHSGCTPYAPAPVPPPTARTVHGRSLSLPTSVVGVTGVGTVTVISTLGEAPSEPRSAPHQKPADYLALAAELVASFRSPSPSRRHSPSPLSRFSATRTSVDAVVDVVGAQVPGFFGVESHFAPRSMGLNQTVPLEADALEVRDRALLDELLGDCEPASGAPRGGPRRHSSASFTDLDSSPVNDRCALVETLTYASTVAAPCASAASAPSCARPSVDAVVLPTCASSFFDLAAPTSLKRTCASTENVATSAGSEGGGALERAEGGRSLKKARLAHGGRGDEASRSAR